MQIHELTQKRPVSEGVLGALAQGIGQQVANKFIDKQLGGAAANPARRPKAKAAAGATKTAAAKLQPGTAIKTPYDVQIYPATNEHPTIARYNKQVYSLTDDGKWVDVRDRTVGTTMTALLNKALEQT